MKYVAIFFSAFLSAAVSAGPIVNVKGNLYEIEVIGNAAYQIRATLESQVWFGDLMLAQALSNEVGVSFGTPNIGMYGPMFAHTYYDGPIADYATGFVYYANRFGNSPDNRAQENNFNASYGYSFAVGTFVGRNEVPEPGTLSLVAFAALLVAGRLRTTSRQSQRMSARQR